MEALVAGLLLVPGLLVLAALVAFAWRTRRISGWLGRWSARIAALPVAYLLCAVWWLLLDRSLERGTWSCRACGRCEERLLVLGVAVTSEDTPAGDSCLEVMQPYSAWFEERVAREHEHDWVPEGCHGIGLSTVACHRRRPRKLYAALPQLPDPAVARSLATRLADADVESRSRLLDDFEDEDAPNPFLRPDGPGQLSPAEFAAGYELWLARHPEWR